ncbi:hypothetical protein IE53DRAFT_215759 [Violaceomyces palustris]|uniref:Uncharacterized protein n=1 Tax=Violaceomyces palustris TaxID=1673888 RepID=A0ACD0P853_9BASI|nr:hypothetical protein IE53DRAFT_215759 [Violaceomyces palustris]
MPVFHLIPGDASMLFTRSLILLIWGFTPLCWAYVGLRALLTIPSVHDRFETLLGSLIPSDGRASVALSHLRPSSHPRISKLVLLWALVEVAFSFYHASLVRRIQSPGPRPLYGRKFLRGVFAKALQSGIAKGGKVDEANATASGRTTRSQSRVASQDGNAPNGREDLVDIPDIQMRQRYKRLRSASFVPDFVHRPLEAKDPRAQKFQESQSKWFFGAPFPHITRRDVEQWLSWSLFGVTLEELEEERASGKVTSASASPMPASVATFATNPFREEDKRGVMALETEWDPTTGDRLKFLTYCLELLEARQGRPFPERSPLWDAHHDERSSPRIKMMRLTIDPVRVSGRPLMCYLFTNAMTRAVIYKSMLVGGFEWCQQGRLPYLLRTPKGWQPSSSAAGGVASRPLVILHGLGIGLAQYANLLKFFEASPRFRSRPIMVLLQPNISQNIFSRDFLKPFGHHETTAAFRSVIQKQGWDRCGLTVLSHSYGSLVHSWLLKSLGDLIKRSCFVDPVCFQLWVPHVCGNFLYKRVETPIELLMRYFVGRELGTANTLCRHFDWSSNILWPEEIPNLTDANRTRFYLAELDSILSATETKAYLHESGVPEECVHFGRDKAHGEMLMHGGEEFKHIVDWLTDEAE